MEYWYNSFIDSTLGYSTYEGTVEERFSADYDVPSGGSVIEYYPDATHIKKGSIIFHEDIGTTTKHNWHAWKTKKRGWENMR